MDIREIPTRDLAYHFVLYYNIPAEQMRLYYLDGPSIPGDNAVLTYCYIDSMAGLSFALICRARVYEDGRVVFREPSRTARMNIREGALISDACVFPEGGDFTRFQDWADQIKDGYGYQKYRIDELNEKSFPDRRHVCYPDDVMVFLYGMGMKAEQIWATDVEPQDYPEDIKELVGTTIVKNSPDGNEEMRFAGAARLINEPYNEAYGYHMGSIVPIYSLKQEDGTELPIVPANMFTLKRM